MACKISFSLVLESLTGDIGDDWEYSVQAKVFNSALTGAGGISIPEHRLTPGTSQQPPGPVQVIEIPAGDCGTGPRVELTVTATEVDWAVDDHGSNVMVVPMECPGPGGPAFIIEPEIAVRVREAPRFLGGVAVFRVKVRLVASCV